MTSNFFIFFLFYFLILISIIGYGTLISVILNFNHKHNLGFLGINGIFFLTFYSYLSNLFIAHSSTHNLVIVIVGIAIFFYFLKNKTLKSKKDLILSSIVFVIIFISLLIYKNHDDFPYYHFPYTYYLTQESFSFGVGQFVHAFRTPSSIFYLNSLFFLPIAEYFLFNFSAAYILGFVNIILLKKIHLFFVHYKPDKELNYKTDFVNFLSLLVFIFINIFFYRLGEHGTDRSAQILIFVLIILLFEYMKNSNPTKVDLNFIYILLGIIVSLKAFYILYLSLFFPLFHHIYRIKKTFKETIYYFILNKAFFILSIFITLVLFSYFANTGCLIYPLSFTCLENLSWSIPKTQVIASNDWFELWSKGGATPNFIVEDREKYIQGLNWVSNWIDIYFFNKVSDFLAGIIFLTAIILYYCYKFKNISNINVFNNIKNLYGLIFILIILTFEWFYNHPALRYGGYCLICLLLFLPSSIWMSKFNINHKKYTQLVFSTILITLIVFILRNYNRIDNEHRIYGYKPFTETFYNLDDKIYFRVELQMKNFDKKRIKTVFGKKIYTINK